VRTVNADAEEERFCGFKNTPEVCGASPVNTLVREGLQAGAAQWTLANNTPRSAKASR